VRPCVGAPARQIIRTLPARALRCPFACLAGAETVCGLPGRPQSEWRAEGESLLRSQRTRAGLARARAQGKHIGRPKSAKDKDPGKRPREGYKREAAKRLLAGAGQYRNSRYSRALDSRT
jgi:hypothetical protein